MGNIHNTFDCNNSDDISMITSYRALEKNLKERFEKHPDDAVLLCDYTWIMSWNQLVKFYVEMVNNRW